jgi:Tfp pilus assembly PilM family ATPase
MARHTVLEITDSDLKVLQVNQQRKGPVVVEHAFSVDVADLPRDEEGQKTRRERLVTAVKERRLTPGPIAIVLPKQVTIVRTVQLPSADPVELAGMAQFEAEKFIQFNAERHIISHGVMRHDGERGSHVLLAAVDGPVIESAIEASVAAGFEPRIAEVSTISLARAFTQRIHPEPVEGVPPTVLLLNIGRSAADIGILRDGILEAARSQPINLDKLAEESSAAGNSWLDVEVEAPSTQEWIGRLMRFVRQTIEFASREHELPFPSVAYLSGEGSQVDGLANAISMNLGVTVSLFDPMDKFEIAPSIQPSTFPAFAAPIGMLDRLLEEELQPKRREGRVNLIPGKVLESQEASERKLLLVVSATMILITLVLVYLAFDIQSAHKQELERLYREHNRAMRTVVEDIELKQERLEIIDGIKTRQASPLAILDQLTTYPGVGSTIQSGRLTLTNFKYSQAGEVIIAGMALDLEDISSFADFLGKVSWQEEPIFLEIGIPTSQPSDALGRNRPKVWTFSITCKLSNPGAPSGDDEEEES